MPLQDLAVGLGSKKQKKAPLSISWFDKFKSNADSSGGNSSAYRNPEGSDTKDGDSVTVPLPSVMFEDDTPDIYDGPEFTFTPEIYTAAQQSANRAAIYYSPDEALQEAYEADMAGKGSDEPDETGGFGVPGVTVKDVTGTDAGALSNPQPLYDMADEFANPSITTTELPSSDQEASLMDALMEGQPTRGLMSRPSSFVGEGVQTASLLDGAKTPAEMQTILGNLFPEEEVVDVSPAAEAADQVAPTETVEAVEPVQNVKFKFKLGSTQGKRERAVYEYAKDQGLSGTELNAFMAQVGHESGNYTLMREKGYSYSKNYAAMPQAWKDRLARDGVNAQNATAASIFNSVYANRNGNGDFASGDGNKYRGRGYIQLTGRKNYRDIGKDIGVDLEANPKLMEKPDIAMKASVAWWKRNVQGKVSDYSDVNAVSGLVNRGDATKKAQGLAERRSLYSHYSTQVQSGTSVRPRLRGLMSR